MAIRTIYEVSKPDQQFYSVERVGYTTLSAAAADIGTDLVKLGAFTVANVKYEIDVGGTIKNAFTNAWPPAARQYSLSFSGAGYKVGDKLQLVGGTSTEKFQLTVTGLKSINIDGLDCGGGINTFTVNTLGKYTQVPGPSASVALAYEEAGFAHTEIEIRGDLTAADGSNINPPARNTMSVGRSASVWTAAWGADGSGGTSGTRHPTTGAWVFTSKTGSLSDILPGAHVFIKSGDSGSSIPVGTVVKETYNRQVVFGLSLDWPNYFEVTQTATFVVFSNPVTLKKGDTLGFRGRLATMDNTQVTVPDDWTAVFEATGASDPLNDNVGVFGNVAVSSSNSNQLQITNILTTNTYNPVIYEGQTVSSLPDDPNPVPDAITVVSVDNYYTSSNGTKTFKANVTLSSNISIASGKTLRFRFAQPQPWRLALQLQKNTSNPSSGTQTLNVYAGTDLQLADDCSISKVYDSSGSHIDWAGTMGDIWSNPASGTPNRLDVSQGFYNREARVSESPENYPLNYSVTITNRGVFVGMWEGNWSTMQKAAVSTSQDNFFNWFLIQRAVNRLTGKVVTTGRCPVFCVNGVGYKYWKFIVREEDVMHPTVGPADSRYRRYNSATNTFTTVNTPYRTPADYHTVDNFAILNTTNQISLTEDSKYLISLINNLTTPRFRYSDELDMIGQTSADVVGQGAEIPINAYGQSLPRYYRALPANNKFNTGLRICVLKDVPPA